MTEAKNGIEMRQISKQFYGKCVLNTINLYFEEGKIHAIVGENGAGKSTLMNILSGVFPPSSGCVYIGGKQVTLASPKDAVKLKIGMIHQHFMLIPTLSVWQNIILGNEPQKGCQIDKKAALEHITQTCGRYGIELNLHKSVGSLTVGEQQRVEILKVLCQDASYIIFDEPTAVLTPNEIEQLMDNIRHLKQLGKTILFISHKLEEVMSISDTVTVLRGGENQGTVDAAKTDMQEIVKKMVGRDIDLGKRIINPQAGKKVLEVKEICTRQRAFSVKLNRLSLEVRAGEIVGVAGVDGNGQLELVNALLRMEPLTAGRILLAGENIAAKNTSQLRKESVACIPPDRHAQGLVLNQSIFRNATLGCEDRKEFKNGIFISQAKVRRAVDQVTDKYQVKYNSLQQEIKDLSGGNQQKVILARECEWKGKNLIIAVNPTRGLDVGAMEFVYEKLNEQKLQGKAILLISTELSEILTLSDRIAVIFRGEIVEIIENEDVDVQRIGALMAGMKTGGTEHE